MGLPLVYPWPGRFEHYSDVQIGKWLERCRAFGVTPTYSVSTDWSSGADIDRVVKALAPVGGKLGVVWMPNEKDGAKYADPTWDAAQNDEDWKAQHAVFASKIPVGMAVAACIDVECYVYDDYLKACTSRPITPLPKAVWNRERKKRLFELLDLFYTAYGVVPSMYGAYRMIPQVRQPQMAVSNWGVSVNIDGPWGFAMPDMNWWHVPDINAATLVMTARNAGDTKLVCPSHWVGVCRGPTSDVATVVDLEAQCTAGELYAASWSCLREVWAYTSVKDSQLKDIGVSRAEHEIALNGQLDSLFKGLYR